MPSQPRETLASNSEGEACLVEALEALAAHQQALTSAFYDRFFDQHPEVVPLFGEHGESEREEMLNETLTSLLAWNDDEPWLAANLEAMGASHSEYGVAAEMYDAFVQTFIACARDELRDVWSDALEGALTHALEAITAVMRRAGERAEARARERKLRAHRSR